MDILSSRSLDEYLYVYHNVYNLINLYLITINLISRNLTKIKSQVVMCIFIIKVRLFITICHYL